MKTVAANHETMIGRKVVVLVNGHEVPGTISDTTTGGGIDYIGIDPDFAHHCTRAIAANWHSEYRLI